MATQLESIDHSAALTLSADEHKRAVISALRDSFYPGATLESVEMVFNYCAAARLDPMTRPVHIVPMSVKKPGSREYQWRDVVMPGIELYRIKADRTGQYAGQDEAEFGPEQEGWNMRYPAWCKITVYKITSVGKVPYTATVRWLESYATKGKDDDSPNSMWRKRPYGQLEKCCEAAVLRKAFPEVGAQPTADEMAGKTIEPMERDMGAAQVVEGGDSSRTESVKNRLAALQAKHTQAPETAPAVTLDAVLEAMAAAQDMDALKAVPAAELADQADKAKARKAYTERAKALKAQAEAKPEPLDLTPPSLFDSLMAAAATATDEEDRNDILDAARECTKEQRDQIVSAFPS